MSEFSQRSTLRRKRTGYIVPGRADSDPYGTTGRRGTLARRLAGPGFTREPEPRVSRYEGTRGSLFAEGAIVDPNWAAGAAGGAAFGARLVLPDPVLDAIRDGPRIIKNKAYGKLSDLYGYIAGESKKEEEVQKEPYVQRRGVGRETYIIYADMDDFPQTIYATLFTATKPCKVTGFRWNICPVAISGTNYMTMFELIINRQDTTTDTLSSFLGTGPIGGVIHTKPFSDIGRNDSIIREVMFATVYNTAAGFESQLGKSESASYTPSKGSSNTSRRLMSGDTLGLAMRNCRYANTPGGVQHVLGMIEWITIFD